MRQAEPQRPAVERTPDRQAATPASLHRIAVVELADEAATSRLGEDLALRLQAGDVVALTGDLGAGKSTLSRAIVRALADNPDLEVPSPTYTLVQTYETSPPIAHFDLYRLGDEAELTELGLEEASDGGIALVEWADKAPELFAAAAIRIDLSLAPNGGRIANIEARGPAAERMRRTLAIRDFLRGAGLGEARRRHFTGDASARRYETVDGSAPDRPDVGTSIVMDAPRQPDGPPVRDGLPYSRIAHLAEDVLPFVAIAETLSREGFAAPAILARDLDEGLVLLEHLGTETLLDDAGAPIPERYEAAIACLAELHRREWNAEIALGDGNVHHVPDYDRRAMGMEVDLVIDWYLPREKRRSATADERALFAEIWGELFDELRAADTSLVLRDFHSPNVIWRENAQGAGRIGLIDFQDAVMGPAAYDVASLAQDARVDVSPELEARLVAAYIARRKAVDPAFDAFGFERDYAIMSTQRNSKILGIFVRLLERDGKPQYLRHIPRIKGYLARTLGHPSLAALRSLYANWGIVEGGRDPGAN